jgi:serine/threonine-protein kinase RsbW
MDAIVGAVRDFGGGAAQEDDMTAVLVRRDGGAAALSREFPRSFASIDAMVAFTQEAFARLGVDPALKQAVDFTVEELFTNMVKYATGSASPVRVDLKAIDGGVEVALVDGDVERFDPTRAPDVDIHARIEERRPGGLGLHLIRRMVDSIEYQYSESTRQGRIVFRKTATGPTARAD